MEGIRSFLNSSSIHGLGHISGTRKLSRFFWIFVVFSGFSFAGFLINQSFVSWAQHPIVTTIETLRADQMKLPKVTVCPPKNSFTDLNYDLMLMRNMSFTYEMVEELSNYAKYSIDIGYLKYLDNIKDKEHFYNWYRGLSPLELPILRTDGKTAPHPMIDYTLTSYALSGNITTEYFGEKYSLDLLERNMDYQVKICIPDDLKNNKDTKINLKLEWVRTEKGRIRMSRERDSGVLSFLEFSKEYSLTTYQETCIYVTYNHKITEENFHMNSMPGFKLSWYYSGLGLPSSPKPITFGSGDLTNSFRRSVSKKIRISFWLRSHSVCLSVHL